MYERQNRLSSRLQVEVIKTFVTGDTALVAEEDAGVKSCTANLCLIGLNRMIASHPKLSLVRLRLRPMKASGGVRKS